jgi:MEMO1 family protein
MGEVRPPAAAGTFYPAEAARLRATVETYLAAAVGANGGPIPKAVIAPHAGYVYSGPVAGHAFAPLGQGGASGISRVVVIGPAHFVSVRGLAVPTVLAFRTPLGDVSLDGEAIEAIRGLPQVEVADAPHRPEHALEVELPFLQTLLGSFALVPLLVGDADPRQVAQLLGRLWGGPDTLIIVSSDLSHYHDYDTARRLDAATAAAIERGEWRSVGPDRACGFLAVAGLLVEADRRGLAARRLALCNSGDTAGPRDRVVGYGAWMWEETPRDELPQGGR